MHRTILLMAFIAAAATIAAGCDPGAAKSATAGSANALLGEETAVDTETESAVPSAAAPSPETSTAAVTSAGAEEEGEDESTPESLEVTWTDSADTAATTVLSFTVANAADVALSFEVAVVARSLVGEARKEIGESTLGVGESAAFSIAAQDLPVRSSTVIGQAFIELTREIVQYDGAIVSSKLLAGRLVRHDAGYGTVRAFTDETLQSELGGTLWSTAASTDSLSSASGVAEFEAESLGDVYDGASGYEVVTQGSASSDLLVRNKEGTVIGFLSDVQEIAMTPEAAEAASAEEMEASDE
jgi:hypothetical protein